MDRIKLVVYNEYALGYIMPERPNTVYTLADSVLRGAPFRVMLEPYYISSHDTVRLAGRQDLRPLRLYSMGTTIPMCTSLTLTDNKKIPLYYNRKIV